MSKAIHDIASEFAGINRIARLVHRVRVAGVLALLLFCAWLEWREVPLRAVWAMLSLVLFLNIVVLVQGYLLRRHDRKRQPLTDAMMVVAESAHQDDYVREAFIILLVALRNHETGITRDMLISPEGDFAKAVHAYSRALPVVLDWERFLARLRNMTDPADLRDGEDISVSVIIWNKRHRVVRHADGPVEISADLTA